MASSSTSPEVYKINRNAPAGMRDFIGDELVLRQFILDVWKQVSARYNSIEYDASPVESAALWVSKEGSDDIMNEMFMIGTELCLRPEMTPTLCRMLLDYLPGSILPLKMISYPQCFRNEAVGRERKAEFFQWNVDIIGGETAYADIECLSVLVESFRVMGFTSKEITIKVNSRRIIQKVLANYGIGEDRFGAAVNVVDKFAKLSPEELVKMFYDRVEVVKETALQIYDDLQDSSFENFVKLLGDDNADLVHMKKVLDLAKFYDIADWLQFDGTITRGLAYYTGIVFEAFSNHPNNRRALAGGGRYDDLLSKYGYHEKLSGVGFGVGDVILANLIKEYNINYKSSENKVDYLVVPFNEELFGEAAQIASDLRRKGKNIDLYIRDKAKKSNIKAALDYANGKKYEKVILVFPDEFKNGQVKIKNMTTSEQVVVNIQDIE